MLINKRVAVIDWPGGAVVRAFTRKGACLVLLGACCLTAFAQQSTPSSPFVAEAKKDYAAVKNNLLKAADKMPEEGYFFQATPDVRAYGALIAHVAEVQSVACGTLLGTTPSKRPQDGAWVADSHGRLLADTEMTATGPLRVPSKRPEDGAWVADSHGRLLADTEMAATGPLRVPSKRPEEGAWVADSHGRLLADTEMAATGPLRASKPAEPGKSKAEVVAALKASFDACDTAYDSVTEANQLQIAGTGLLKRSRLAVLFLNNEHDNETYGTMSVYLRLKGIVPPSSDDANKR